MKRTSILFAVTLFSYTGFSQTPPLAPVVPKDPEKEIIYKEKYDGYKYKVVPTSATSVKDCDPKEPKKEPVPVPKPKPKPRPKPQPKPVPVPVPQPAPCPACPKVEPEKQVVYKPHEITVLAGMGADGMQVSEQTEGKQVDKYYGLVLGARYTYRFDPSWGISVEGLSNNTGIFGVGYSFGERSVK